MSMLKVSQHLLGVLLPFFFHSKLNKMGYFDNHFVTSPASQPSDVILPFPAWLLSSENARFRQCNDREPNDSFQRLNTLPK